MGILDRFRKKTVPAIEQKGQTTEVIWPLPEGSFIEYALGLGGRVTASKAMQFYRTNSTIATAVDKIATKVEQISPVLKTKDNKFIKEHPVIDLLKSPNPFDTWQEFIGKMSRHYLLKHDSHLSLLGNVQRPPLELYAVKPENVSTTQAADYFPAAYNVTVGPGRGHYLRKEVGRLARFLDGNMKEFYHMMGFSSRSDEIQGDSPLEAAALEAKQQIQGRTHNLSLLKNGGRLSLVVSFKDADGTDDDEHKLRKQRINEDLGGSGNAGKIAVVSGAQVDIKEVGTNNKDMDYAMLDKVASQAIYLRYEIPLPLVSTDASTYNNVENALFDFYENTVLPHVDILFSGLSKVLLPRYGIDDMVISYDPESINTLIRQKLEEIKTRKDINIETINELRALLPNRESISAGGDTLYQPAILVPVGEDLFTDDNMTPEELAAQLSRDAGIED
ncbi:MAG: phage portal protein [Candidatus Peribacteraceae bacterium]|nr:phage portal protein [Candidatus Peribacteraceae bacterium]